MRRNYGNSLNDVRDLFEVYLNNRTGCSKGDEVEEMFDKRDRKRTKLYKFRDRLLNISKDRFDSGPIVRPWP